MIPKWAEDLSHVINLTWKITISGIPKSKTSFILQSHGILVEVEKLKNEG